jgi:hypothetical protein
VYDFVRTDGKIVTIREHSLGHTKGNVRPHFNVEMLDPRNPSSGNLVPKDQRHVYFPTYRGASGGYSGGGCFMAGTLVATDKGLINIEDIHLNDRVYSYNHDINQIELKPVIQVYSVTRDDLVEVSVARERIISSSNHRYFVLGLGYVDAEKLVAGQEVITKTGKIRKVKQVSKLDSGKINLYNFSVKDNRNYFVSAAKVLVHNNKMKPGSPAYWLLPP